VDKGGAPPLNEVRIVPPPLPVAAALAGLLRGQRYGIWSMHLPPDAVEAIGLINPGGLPARGLHGLTDPAEDPPRRSVFETPIS